MTTTDTRARAFDPRAARRRARFDGILDAAWAVAREQGLAAVSLHEVARRVGLRQPSLYAYIDSKAGLYDAMYAQGFGLLLEHLAAVPRRPDPREDVVAVSRAIVEFVVADIPRQQLLFERTIPGFTPSDASYAVSRAFSANVGDRLRAAGVREPEDVDVYTALIAGLTLQQIANEPGGDRWTRQLERVIAMFLDAIDRREPT